MLENFSSHFFSVLSTNLMMASCSSFDCDVILGAFIGEWTLIAACGWVLLFDDRFLGGFRLAAISMS